MVICCVCLVGIWRTSLLFGLRGSFALALLLVVNYVLMVTICGFCVIWWFVFVLY